MTLWHVLFKCVFFPWIFEAKNSTRWPPRFKATAEFHHLELSLKNHGSPKLGMGGNGTYINTLRFRFGDVTPQGDWIPIGFPFPLFFLDKNTRKAPIYRSWNLRERSAEEELGDGNSLFFLEQINQKLKRNHTCFMGLTACWSRMLKNLHEHGFWQ